MSAASRLTGSRWFTLFWMVAYSGWLVSFVTEESHDWLDWLNITFMAIYVVGANLFRVVLYARMLPSMSPFVAVLVPAMFITGIFARLVGLEQVPQQKIRSHMRQLAMAERDPSVRMDKLIFMADLAAFLSPWWEAREKHRSMIKTAEEFFTYASMWHGDTHSNAPGSPS